MLENYRKQIDLIDKKILELLKERFVITDKIWLYKKQNNISVLQPQRYKQLLEEKIKLWKSYWLDEEFIKKIFDTIHTYSVKSQEKL